MATMTEQQAHDIYVEAYEAGVQAANSIQPRPMIVQQVGLDDQPFPGTEPEIVWDGLCGFAWVVIKPARGPFVNYLKKRGVGDKHYEGGWNIWISEYNQSYERKEAHADAMAEIFRKHGLNAYAGSRLD